MTITAKTIKRMKKIKREEEDTFIKSQIKVIEILNPKDLAKVRENWTKEDFEKEVIRFWEAWLNYSLEEIAFFAWVKPAIISKVRKKYQEKLANVRKDEIKQIFENSLMSRIKKYDMKIKDLTEMLDKIEKNKELTEIQKGNLKLKNIELWDKLQKTQENSTINLLKARAVLSEKETETDREKIDKEIIKELDIGNTIKNFNIEK